MFVILVVKLSVSIAYLFSWKQATKVSGEIISALIGLSCSRLFPNNVG